VVGQGDPLVETPKLSGFLYAWGQFIDHDLDLNRADQVNHIDIVIPQNDQSFPPGSVIPVTRGTVAAGTGAGTDKPAAAVNSISGWMDASQVYGSSKATADSLRVHNPDGSLDAHLATSEGNNLPIVNGMFRRAMCGWPRTRR
jgi:peroxidase